MSMMMASFTGANYFRPGYAANLVSLWIPALQDVKEKLERGARVADVGCGKGASTLLMAKAFPKSRFFGFDYHDKSIEAARDSAKREGVAGRVTFDVAKAREYPGKDYDFVAVLIVCTIWATRLELPPTSADRLARMGHG